MFESRFTGDARRVVIRASKEVADGVGSPQIEAEHLLLALATGPADDRAAQALREEGLDAETLREAIAHDGERVLAKVGIDVSGVELPPRPRRAGKSPRVGASAKRALELGVRDAAENGEKKIRTHHLLLGLLRAEHGVVPRLLATEGVDRAALVKRLA
jgi:ATP-dependent Clp protease ATP-binding subunit ClpA